MADKRVVVLFWKRKMENPVEVFSNLKNLCLSFPQFNYNTLNNYLGKAKVAYENDDVRIERKNVISQPIKTVSERKIVSVVRKVPVKDANDSERDLEYWLSQPAEARVAAVTRLVRQTLKPGQRMDKTVLKKRKIK